ncbi:hypothetical protein ACFQZ4_14040 [Catellatospora coxensis]
MAHLVGRPRGLAGGEQPGTRSTPVSDSPRPSRGCPRTYARWRCTPAVATS